MLHEFDGFIDSDLTPGSEPETETESSSESSESESSDSESVTSTSLTPYLDEYDTEELFEEACTLCHDYTREHIGKMSHPDFHESLRSYVYEQLRIVLFAVIGNDTPVDCDKTREYMTSIIDKACKFIFTELNAVDCTSFPPWRSCSDDSCSDYSPVTPGMVSHITKLQNMQDQTEQRTPAWYQRRHNMITASSAWKAFGTDAVMNQLIYEKCKPFTDGTSDCGIDGSPEPVSQFVNVDSPLHWGQKYEYLSAAIYQLKNNTRLGEFGCIQHSDPALFFLGGSPDGINIDETSPLYGRMVEIKNIVNREITGIPKEEYWIQMQIQMEVCDLESCDFVETRFKEYEYVEDYEHDVEIDYHYRSAEKRAGSSEFDICDDDFQRGIIIYFIEKSTRKPCYEYMPMHYKDIDTQDAWVVNTIFDKEKTGEYAWIRNIYWKLDEYSCVLVKRNRLWFTLYAESQFKKIWNIIETERVTGYAHRAPKKRGGGTLLQSNKNKNNNYNTETSDDGYFQTRLCGIVL
jgi:hypothetical protein